MKLFGKWRKETVEVTEETAFDPSAANAAVSKQDSSLGQNRKILVVDDNPVVLLAFEMKLKSLGFQVVTASDGSAAER